MAPIGAVIMIDKTAIVRIKLPEGTPIVKGTAPIAACTVAFGIYDTEQKALSFLFKLVLIRERFTPIILKNKAAKTKTKENKPALPI